MATHLGTLDTRILMATGTGAPIEVGTVHTKLIPRFDGTSFTIETHKHRRTLAAAFLRMAIHALTARP